MTSLLILIKTKSLLESNGVLQSFLAIEAQIGHIFDFYISWGSP